MGDITQLPPRAAPADLVWTCACGCTTHHHHADGRVTCGSCGNPADGAQSGWREAFEEPPPTPPPMSAANFKVVPFDTPERWVKARIRDAERSNGIAAMLFVHHDGGISTWVDEGGITAKRLAWLRRRLALALRRLSNQIEEG